MLWLTYLKIGAVVVLVAVGSYFYLNYNRMQAKIATQEVVIAQQAITIEFYLKSQKIDVDTAKTKEEGKKVIESGNPQKIIDFFERLRKESQAPQEDE
jgi:hypothetical protein